nr:hypothetical protein [Tanacetum cinerariifolium]
LRATGPGVVSGEGRSAECGCGPAMRRAGECVGEECAKRLREKRDKTRARPRRGTSRAAVQSPVSCMGNGRPNSHASMV